jgi:hypothetical protein
MEYISCWLCFRMPRLGAMNPARHYHYCSQRSEVLWFSPQGLLDINYASCLTRQGERLTNVGNPMGCRAGPSTTSQTSLHSRWAESMSGGNVEELYLRLSQVTGQAPGLWCSWQSLSPQHLDHQPVLQHLEKGETQTQTLQPTAEAPLIPMFTLRPLGFLGECQTNSKPETKLQWGFNQYSFGGTL